MAETGTQLIQYLPDNSRFKFIIHVSLSFYWFSVLSSTAFKIIMTLIVFQLLGLAIDVRNNSHYDKFATAQSQNVRR